MPFPIAAVYAGAWIGGQLGGIALGTTIVKKVLPSNRSSSNFQMPASPIDTGMVGMLDQFFNKEK